MATSAPLPRLVRPLFGAASRGEPLTAALQQIVSGLGFDSFMFGVTSASHPKRDTRAFVWTSLPQEWVQIYETREFIEVDPRLRGVWDSPAPLIWDRTTFTGTRHRAFLKAAADFGLRSGLALPVQNPYHVHGIFSLNSSLDRTDAARRAHLRRVLGPTLVLSVYVYELLLASVVAHCLPSPISGGPFTRRQLECLRLVAKGFSSAQAAGLLGVSERTINFHVGKLLGKMAVNSRREAVTRAIAAGWIHP
jgi:DNA-binding CsgD family transcriptional regulator